LLFFGTALTAAPARAADPLPSENEGASKQAILDFVTDLTTREVTLAAVEGGLGMHQDERIDHG
jgi:hypothetical protein